jgi:tetratricopeptide (TPR) repeat protein
VFRKQGTDRWGLALALNDLGNVRRRRGEIPEALELYNQSLDLWKDLEDIWGLPLTRSNLGFLLMMDKKFGQARGELEEALEVQRSVNDRWGSAETLKYLGDLAVREEKYQEAEEHYLESLRGNQESGRRQFMIGCLAGLAVSSAGKRRTKLAAFLFGTVSSLREEIEVSERIFDEEMFQQAWRGLDSELRDSPGFQKEHKDGARRKDPAAKLEQAIKKVQELLLPEGVNSTRSAPRPQSEADTVAMKDLLPLKRSSGDRGAGDS